MWIIIWKNVYDLARSSRMLRRIVWSLPLSGWRRGGGAVFHHLFFDNVGQIIRLAGYIH